MNNFNSIASTSQWISNSSGITQLIEFYTKCTTCYIPIGFFFILLSLLQVYGQTEAERKALSSLGAGIVVYDNFGKITAYEFSDTNIYPAKILYDVKDTTYLHSPMPCIGADGNYVYFRKCYNDDSCEFWRVGIDGSNPQCISNKRFPYPFWFRQSWSTPNDFVFCSGPEPKSGLWYHSSIYRLSVNGNSSLILNLNGDRADFLDISGTIVTYRKNRNGVYIYDSMKEEETFIANGCSQSLNPDGTRLIINKFGHMGYKLFEKPYDEWICTDSIDYPFHLGSFKWSNNESWFASVTENQNSYIGFAVNVESHKLLRITFDNSGIIRWPNLYLQDAHPVHTTTAMHNKNKRIIHASINGNSLSAFTPVYGRIKLFIYDLRGRQLFGWHGKGPDIYLKHITSLQRGTYIIHVSSISMSFKRTILVR